MARLTDPAPPAEPRRHWLVLVALALAASGAPLTLIVNDIRGVSRDVALLGAVSVILCGLVLARVRVLAGALDSSNRRLSDAARRLRQVAERQVALTESAVAFVAAGDARAVAEAAARAAVTLAGGGAWAAYVAGGSSGLTVVAVAGPAPWPVDHGVDAVLGAEWVHSCAGLYARLVEPGVLEPGVLEPGLEPGGAAGWPGGFVGPVRVGHALRGLLVVAAERAGDDFLPVLGLVCSQMSLALESVETTEERHRARNERQFRSLVHHSSDVVTLIGVDGIVRYQSPSALTVLGWDADSCRSTW